MAVPVTLLSDLKKHIEASEPLLSHYKKFCSNPGFNTNNKVTNIRLDLLPNYLSKPDNFAYYPRELELMKTGLLPFDDRYGQKFDEQYAKYASFDFIPVACGYPDMFNLTVCQQELLEQKNFFWDRLLNNKHDWTCSKEAEALSRTFFKDLSFFDTRIPHPDLLKKFDLITAGTHLLHCKKAACGEFSGYSALQILASEQEKSHEIHWLYGERYFSREPHQWLMISSGLPSLKVQEKANIEKLFAGVSQGAHICDSWNGGYFSDLSNNKIRMYQDGKLFDELESRVIRWSYDFQNYSEPDKSNFYRINRELNEAILKISDHFNFKVLGTSILKKATQPKIIWEVCKSSDRHPIMQQVILANTTCPLEPYRSSLSENPFIFTSSASRQFGTPIVARVVSSLGTFMGLRRATAPSFSNPLEQATLATTLKQRTVIFNREKDITSKIRVKQSSFKKMRPFSVRSLPLEPGESFPPLDTYSAIAPVTGNTRIVTQSKKSVDLRAAIAETVSETTISDREKIDGFFLRSLVNEETCASLELVAGKGVVKFRTGERYLFVAKGSKVVVEGLNSSDHLYVPSSERHNGLPICLDTPSGAILESEPTHTLIAVSDWTCESVLPKVVPVEDQKLNQELFSAMQSVTATPFFQLSLAAHGLAFLAAFREEISDAILRAFSRGDQDRYQTWKKVLLEFRELDAVKLVSDVGEMGIRVVVPKELQVTADTSCIAKDFIEVVRSERRDPKVLLRIFARALDQVSILMDMPLSYVSVSGATRVLERIYGTYQKSSSKRTAFNTLFDNLPLLIPGSKILLEACDKQDQTKSKKSKPDKKLGQEVTYLYSNSSTSTLKQRKTQEFEGPKRILHP